MLETIKALYRSHSIAPGRSSASRSYALTNSMGEKEFYNVQVDRGAIHILLPFIRETLIDASVETQQKDEGEIKSRVMKTGFAVYSVLGLVPFARRYGSQSFRDFDGRQGSAKGIDVATLNRALTNTTRRSGAVTNY